MSPTHRKRRPLCMKSRLKIYICHEPDEGGVASHLKAWSRTNDDGSLYDARAGFTPDSPQAERVQSHLHVALQSADVFVCIIAQGTGFDDWVIWEINAARAMASPPGMVGILLHEADPKPPDMVDAGAIFVPFQRDKVERAIEWAAQNRGKSGDFSFVDD